MLSKLVPVKGDIRESNMGIADDFLHQITQEVDVILNSAANTILDERYLWFFYVFPMQNEVGRGDNDIAFMARVLWDCKYLWDLIKPESHCFGRNQNPNLENTLDSVHFPSAIVLLFHSFLFHSLQYMCRYDASLVANTIAPSRLLSFAKKCKKPSLFLHLSTSKKNEHLFRKFMGRKYNTYISVRLPHIIIIIIIILTIIIIIYSICEWREAGNINGEGLWNGGEQNRFVDSKQVGRPLRNKFGFRSSWNTPSKWNASEIKGDWFGQVNISLQILN